MTRPPQRIVEAALIEGIGPITARGLLTMPEDRWGLLRDHITDRRHGKNGLVARCMACEGEVYIRTAGPCLPTIAEAILPAHGTTGAMPCRTTCEPRNIKSARSRTFTV
ncbi:hypothetical protein MESS2_1700015 [Mesorhizobium metallidurans STM 2683]|uniref:Uncharacterized protein n=1 Tax=Mesorhizobium metallidurans STM 2683 TaxID=1297569 RepID=M5EP51_9HYPH|nr:hypothetical protein MESS2_1700015 [Mesorhizobium metallidurans STM 2683]